MLQDGKDVQDRTLPLCPRYLPQEKSCKQSNWTIPSSRASKRMAVLGRSPPLILTHLEESCCPNPQVFPLFLVYFAHLCHSVLNGEWHCTHEERSVYINPNTSQPEIEPPERVAYVPNGLQGSVPAPPFSTTTPRYR